MVTRGKWSVYRSVSSLVTLVWQPSCHGGMGSLFGGHCRQCNFYRAFLIVLWTLFCEPCLFLCLTCMCFLHAVCLCFFLCVHMPNGCLYEWFGFCELVWGDYYDAIIVHSSCTLQSSLLLQSPDTVKMGTFLANSLSSTVEESLQQTSIARSGSPHNALHSLVSTGMCVVVYLNHVK